MEAPRRPQQPSTDQTSTRIPSWGPSPLRRLARDPRLYWLVAGALTLLTVAAVHRLTSSAADLRAGYGTTVDVYVVNDLLAPGDPLSLHSELVAVPSRFVPEDALLELAAGATARAPVSRGAILTHQDLTSASAVPADHAAVAVPIGPTTPALTPGQGVLVVLHADPFGGIEGGVVTALVHDITPDQALLALPRSDLARLTTALAGNGITIAIT